MSRKSNNARYALRGCPGIKGLAQEGSTDISSRWCRRVMVIVVVYVMIERRVALPDKEVAAADVHTPAAEHGAGTTTTAVWTVLP